MRQVRKWGPYIGLCILLLIIVHNTLAKDSAPKTSRTITDEQWAELTNDASFGYKNEIEHVKKERQLPIERFMLSVLQFFSSPAGKFIIWSLFFLLLGYALYRIFVSEKTALFRRKERNLTGNELQTPEDIHGSDWERLLLQASRTGDLKQAIRYSYMWLLQLLQQHELIQYRADKTNYEYLSDLADTPYKQPFRQLSRQYEYTWYGNFPVAPASYEEYMQIFDNLKKQLDR